MEPLASAADLATATGLAVDDPNLLLALKRASGRFRDNVEHPVSLVENETIRLDGDGSAYLLLPAFPVREISVSIGSLVLTEGIDYTVARRHGSVFKAGGWPHGLENITVTYSHGLDPVPDGIVDAVLEHATTLALAYAHIQQETAGSTQVGYGAAAMVGRTQKWVDAVEKYKVRGRA